MVKRGNQGYKNYPKIDPLNKEPTVEYMGDLKIMPPEKKLLYTKYMKVLAKKTNQDFYTRFKLEHDIDFMPVYVEYSTKMKSMKLNIRTDWMKKKLKAEIDFVSYLRSNEAIGIKHRFIHAKEYEYYIDHKSAATDGIPEFHDKPHWIKKAHDKWSKKYFVDEFKHGGSGGTTLMQSDYEFKDSSITKGSTTEIYRQQFTRPMQSKDLINLFNSENEQVLLGDKNTQTYLRRYKVNQKIYNRIMKTVLGVMWNEFSKIQAMFLSKGFVEAYGESFHARFPNIVRIRNWFVNKGIYNTKEQHQFTTEKFMSLKSNTARSNFIDRAVFVISNSIYAKSNGQKTSKITDDPYSPTPFRKGLTSGKKMPISQARRYKKQSKTREKYHTKRRDKYELWKLDNRKLAANLKRKTTRKDNRLKR